MPNLNTSARNEETECFSLSFVSLSTRSTRKGNDGNDKERNQPLKRAIHQRMTGRLSFLFPPNVRTEETGTGQQPFIAPNTRRMSPPMGGSRALIVFDSSGRCEIDNNPMYGSKLLHSDGLRRRRTKSATNKHRTHKFPVRAVCLKKRDRFFFDISDGLNKRVATTHSTNTTRDGEKCGIYRSRFRLHSEPLMEREEKSGGKKRVRRHWQSIRPSVFSRAKIAQSFCVVFTLRHRD